MYNHPFKRNIFTSLAVLCIIIVTGLLVGVFMVYYQSFTWLNALIAGYMITVVWGIGLYYSWNIYSYLKIWQARFVVGISIQLFSFFLLYVGVVSTALITETDFIRELPFIGICGFLMWIIVMQWYATVEEEAKEETEIESDFIEPEIESIQQEQLLETISVKAGSHIHIIPVEEIYFIQACGDYVNIFTADGQFLKEQTMKSLEKALPISFVRIHRSTIINTTKLLRIELFGKENYHVQLKNGSTLKASLTGYKLLKKRLNL